MADPDVDPSRFTESQQAALGTYTAVTNQEPAAAVSLLQRSEWNVQIAIAKFFDGEAPDPLEEARAAQSSPALPLSSRSETLLSGSPSFPRSPASSPRHPAPRVVPQPQNQNTYTPPLLLQLVLTPFNLLVRLVGGSFSLIGYILSFIPRLLPGIFITRPTPRIRTGRRPLSPRDTAARFAREFEEDYGTHSLNFYEGGYAQAYDLAKRDLKFLLVVLLSPEHDDNSTFVQETLLSQEVTGYINERQGDLILWAGSVQDSEAYQVSSALNCSKFPVAVLVVHTPQDSSAAMSTVARIAGPVSPSAFVAQLKRGIEQQMPALSNVRARRSEQQATRNIREEQNSAYERSLAQDRERARLRKEAEAAEAKAAEEVRLRAEEEQMEAKKVEQWRQWRAGRLAEEPNAESRIATRVSVRMTSGERVVRRFEANTSLEELYAFVECYDVLRSEQIPKVSRPSSYEHVYGFRLVSPMPRTVYEVNEGQTIGSTIGRSANLIVESVDDGDTED